ncbi:hypothetical protein GMD08_12375 [[Ruminococcus] torques]|uniref:Uncharacterized protein n=1 Tax=[Ruminococcus] torques TaxID=33039 RepID=A0A4Q5C5J6_9FIRM|nr:hypothetical protein [[Ruminococcus] torques]RYS77296.1 hypothetical protein EAI93_12415 [[Ruminococcus] torques]
MPKETKGEYRKLGVPTVVDRVIQQAITQELMPIYEEQFSENRFGFRPQKGQHDALRQCQKNVNDGYVYVVDMDLEKFFDTVCQSKLIEVLSRTIKDGRVISLIHKYLNAGVLVKGMFERTEIGMPQGGPLVEVAKGGSCIIRNMETHDGIVNMIRSYCIYENGKLKQSSEDIYRTESWEYTEDGHLMFSGRLAFEGSYEVTRNEIMEYMAYRVLSLDETCRELNRKYILPIGYERNNMFLTDWSEEEFAELDFYDMFDLFYQENHTANGEFTFGNAMGTSAVYLISKEKFEPVIKSKFKISSEVLQSKTVYYPCEEVYEYKPRGLEETEYPEYPYPEVIGYVNNDDGTLTLKVQAVFPYRGVSKAYIHEVTVRDTKDGGIQYVGNRIIEPINNPEIRWHVPRLTRTEWEELYGDN